MRAHHHDLVVEAGATLGLAVRYHRPGARLRVDELTVGSFVYYLDTPWPVYALEPAGSALRVRLGRGLWWEPDLRLRPELETLEAAPQTFGDVVASYRDQYGQRQELPHEVAADGLTLYLVPHTAEAAGWSAELGQLAELDEADVPGPPIADPPHQWVDQRPRTTYDYDVSATFTELAGAHLRIVEGTLAVIASVAMVTP